MLQCKIMSGDDACKAGEKLLGGGGGWDWHASRASSRERLQEIQNYSARIVIKPKPFDHIPPVLRDLHWLPIKSCIDYKVLCIIY